ncbi:MAG: hypothetical protein KJP09_04705 [Bacteroidia bacterium]|nr:hypothetical protein [Bacteroidia bacterium]
MNVKMSYSFKEIKKETNDTTFVYTDVSYETPDGSWLNFETRLRRRGNYRLKNCYFPPIKFKAKKKKVEGTIFEGNKTLKMVMPCLMQKDNNDNVVKEYLAYKLYELISPYHFKTRLMNLALTEQRGNKVREHKVKAFFIEDDKQVAKRFDARVYKRNNHPLNHDPVESVRNAVFMYMIGNTDFSQTYQHNMQIIFVGTSIIPLPFDFDMSGLVNSSYAVVSQIKGQDLGLSSVKERMYRGFVRDEAVFYQVRQEYIDLKPEIIKLLDDHAKYFDNPKEFSSAKEYILSCYNVLANKERFKKEIIDRARNE